MKNVELCVQSSYSSFQNTVTLTHFQATVCFKFKVKTVLKNHCKSRRRGGVYGGKPGQ